MVKRDDNLKKISIKNLLNKVNKELYMPSIQREFVWKVDQIPFLFDSIIQKYPIGEFIAWKVKSKVKWDKYKFIDKIIKDETNYQEKASVSKPVELVIDGQQRITALFIGILGTYKISNVVKRLYININTDSETFKQVGDEKIPNYDIKFFDEEIHPIDPEKETFYIDFKTIFDSAGKKKLIKTVKERYKDSLKNNPDIKDKIRWSKEIEKFLEKLYNRFCIDKLVLLDYLNFNADEYEKILEVFFRANTKGVPLTNADLLLSVMENSFKKDNKKQKGIDPRKIITNLEKEYKKKWGFDRDNILKCMIFFSEKNVKYEPKNFKSPKFIKKIFIQEKSVKYYLDRVFQFLETFHIEKKDIVSNNSLIPLAYYFKQLKLNKKDFDNKLIKFEQKKKAFDWFIKANLNGMFGGSSDTTLNNIKKDIDKKKKLTIPPVKKIDIKQVLEDSNYKSKKTHFLLYLSTDPKLWKYLAETSSLSMDHLFPQNDFKKSLKKHKDKEHSIMNLWLLTEATNSAKMKDDLYEWMNKKNKWKNLGKFCLPKDKKLYKKENFLDFLKNREELMTRRLKGLLN